METLFVLPLSASEWMSDHPIAMLIFAVIWLIFVHFAYQMDSQNRIYGLAFCYYFFPSF